MPGATDIQKDQVTGTPQLRIIVDRDAISRYGINVQDVQSIIRTAVGGEKAGQIFEGIPRFDILVRYVPFPGLDGPFTSLAGLDAYGRFHVGDIDLPVSPQSRVRCLLNG